MGTGQHSLYTPFDILLLVDCICASSVNIYFKMKSTYISKKGRVHLISPKCFVVHLPSRVDFLGGRLVKSC